MFSSSMNEKHGAVFSQRSRRGAVAVMALIIVVVMAILFQAYMVHVLSDIGTGSTFDTQSQYNGERAAIGQLVKEAVLSYYERPRVGQNGSSISAILESYLSAMSNGGAVQYTIVNPNTIAAIFPGNAVTGNTFWPTLVDSDSDGLVMNLGDQTPMGTFQLAAVDISATSLVKSRIAEYVGDPNGVVLSVTNDAGANLFPITISRSEGGLVVATFTYYVSLYQVPITDFNAVAYVIPSDATDIPDNPPALPSSISGPIQNRTISALALSRMDVNNSINQGTGRGTGYPYLYRELFSSCASLWEYVLYNNYSDVNYIASLIPNSLGVYILADPYAGSSVYQTQAVGGTPVLMENMNGSTGFDPSYSCAGTLVNLEGNRVDADGNLVDSTGTVVVDTNGDGVLDATDGVVYVGAPDTVVWTIDLHRVPNAPVGVTAYRTIYVHLPDDLSSEPIPNSSIVITDSASGTAANCDAPVILCVEGWSRANAIMDDPTAAIPPDYPIEIRGGGTGGANMLGQDVILYTVGVSLNITGATQMNGVVIMDDQLGTFTASQPFTLHGLMAWNGNAPAAVSLDNVTLARPPAANRFRAIAPRFLLVDVRSETN